MAMTVAVGVEQFSQSSGDSAEGGGGADRTDGVVSEAEEGVIENSPRCCTPPHDGDRDDDGDSEEDGDDEDDDDDDDGDTESHGESSPLRGISLQGNDNMAASDASFPASDSEQCTKTDVESGGTSNDDQNGEGSRQERSPSTRRRKKVKHRRCKAVLMICVIWSVTVTLISIALGMDWWGVGDRLDRSDDASLCTLCGENGLDLTSYGHWPTRQPTPSNATVFPIRSIDPPPSNLAELCAPSIHLDRGGSLVEGCIRACLPALCCMVNNEKAREGLLSMLGLGGGVLDGQASSYLSTMNDCYSGDDIPVCDAYGEWCSTIYDLQFALEESLPGYFFDACYRNQPGGGCAEICSPVACCYQSEDQSIMRKRYRRHDHDDSSESNIETEWSRRSAEDVCQNFGGGGGQESMQTHVQICNAYSPFCNPSGHSLASTLINGPLDGSTYPSLSPSMLGQPNSTALTDQPSQSTSASMSPTSDTPTFLDPTQQPSEYIFTSIPPSMAPSSERSSPPSVIPSSLPTTETLSTLPVTPSSLPAALSTTVPSESQTLSTSPPLIPSSSPTSAPTLSISPSQKESSTAGEGTPAFQNTTSNTSSPSLTGDVTNTTSTYQSEPSAHPSALLSPPTIITPSVHPSTPPSSRTNAPSVDMLL